MCVLYCTVCLSILVRIIKLHTIAQSGPVISCQRNNTINSIHNTVVVVFISSAVLCYRSKSLALVSPNGGSIYICCVRVYVCIFYKGSGRGRLGAPRPPWRVRVECEEVFVLELSGTHELHTINTTYQVADVRPSGLR